ncbi:fasciclin-1 isoform X2 [Phymastichus coffea]|uniref:fasciclin-1 isoform X2 n=1 Tax=Phymastichus coffea TaxID=108790 RepID=UPI00273C9DF2|nr:fasciclin-1 isoform X2 [Phymastichus coffea]
MRAILLLLSILLGVDAKLSIDAKIREDPDLSEFWVRLESNPIANATLMHRSVTVFAPINKVFQDIVPSGKNAHVNSNDIDNLVLYHISNQALKTEQFGQLLSSELEGNPPLWVTKRGRPGYEEVFINNAQIVEADYESISATGSKKKQVLHKINEILEPVQTRGTTELIYNPDAFQFLNQSENLDLGSHRIRTFHQRVKITRKENVFSSADKYTFFIPVDEGFKPSPRSNKVDSQVIDGHIIPRHVLFTAPTPSNRPYETLAFGDNLKVTISFSTERTNKGTDKYYVKSDTLIGDSTHPTASVLAEIVKPNIPVRNGVVHLIQNPLMVVDNTLEDFIQDKEDGPLYKFYEVIRDQGDQFMASLSKLTNVTLFAPRNAAWDEPGVKKILQDKERIKDLLNLHYTKELLPLNVIERKTIHKPEWSKKAPYAVNSAHERASLYFNAVESSPGNSTVTVEGGGVNATIITANIGATNGIIHIIDRVLGVPYTTILDKLKSDPNLNMTYHLGMKHNFNELLGDLKKRYTFFAPSDKAWQNLQILQPSIFKKLFMDDYAYHARQILEKHLAVDDAFKMKQLVEMSHRTQDSNIRLRAMRSTIDIKVKETSDVDDKVFDENAIVRPSNGGQSKRLNASRPLKGAGYMINWKEKNIKVVKPDVGCTNGVIHVISDVMLKEMDVYVTGSNGASSPAVPNLLMVLVGKLLLALLLLL